MRRTLLAAVLLAAPAVRAEPAPAGLAIGVEAGEPSSATVAFFAGRLGGQLAVGSGTWMGPGLSLHADALAEVARLAPALALRAGLGLRWYDQHYAPASADELPSQNLGIRASLAIAYRRPALELYAELAPGVDVHRTASCTLADGPMSICPHAMERPIFLDVVVGARWYLGIGGGK